MIPPPVWIGGVPIHPLRLSETISLVSGALQAERPLMLMYANAHAVVMAQDNPTFGDDLRAADVVFCDGFGVWLASRLLGQPLPERYTPPDWIDALVTLAARDRRRLFLLGAAPGVTERCAEQLRARHPDLMVATHHGYLDDGETEQALLASLRAFRPDILLVGMGMPRQERWMVAHRGDHGATVTMAVGALFDYMIGGTPRAPRYLTDRGLEWLARLWYEPRRLARRYLVGLPRFAWLVLRQRW